MKIITTDNFGRSGEATGCDERVIATNVSPFWSARIVAAMNEKFSDPESAIRFQAVVDNYEPLVFVP